MNGTTRVRASTLGRPTGIAVRADGTLVVAEAGAGRILAIDEDDTVTVLAEGPEHPVDVALDDEQRCYVSDDRRGAVFRIDDGQAVVIAEGLAVPQGIATRGGELFVLETGHRRLLAISPGTGETRVEAENLAVGCPRGGDPRRARAVLPRHARLTAGVRGCRRGTPRFPLRLGQRRGQRAAPDPGLRTPGQVEVLVGGCAAWNGHHHPRRAWAPMRLVVNGARNGYPPVMRLVMITSLSLLFVGFGLFLAFSEEVVGGVLSALLGVGGIVAVFVERGKRRGDPRAGGLHERHTRGPYLLLGTAAGLVFAAIGVLYLVFTPVSRRGWVDTPTDARILGAVALAFGLLGVVVGVTRWLRSRRA